MLVDEITNYAKGCSSAGRFAIVLYGEWGSGKTFFCEKILAPRLQEEGRTLLRVSLFGVSDTDDLCEKILSTLSHLPKDTFKAAYSLAVSSLNKLLEKYHLRIDVEPQTVLSMLDPWMQKNAFLVLDDVERSGFPSVDANGGSSRDLLGVVNDMVENHNWRVMLIRNKPYALNPSTSEKVIARQFEYCPTPADVYEAVAAPLANAISVDFDVRQATIRGIDASGKINMRAVARALPLLKMILSSHVISSTSIDEVSRSRTYQEIVQSAILAASGAPPSKPSRDDGQAFTRTYIRSFNSYHNYNDLLPIVEPLTTGRLPSAEVIEESLSEYLAKRYPASPADAAIIKMHDQLGSLSTMEDAEATSLTAKFNEVLLRKEFSSLVIVRAWRTYADLAELGFEETLHREGAVSCLKRVIERNPSSAYGAIHEEYEAWLHATPDAMDRDDALDELFSYAKECMDCQTDAYIPKFLGDSINLGSGIQLSKWLNSECNRAYPAIHRIPVSYVAACISSGSASSQLAMRDVIRDALPNAQYRYSEAGRLGQFRRWLTALKDELDLADSGSRLGNYRLGLVRNEVDKLLKDMSAGTN